MFLALLSATGYRIEMGTIASDPSKGPLIRAALSIGAILAVILAAVLVLYRGPPVPSPYGCYEGAGSPLVRLLPGSLIIQSAPQMQQRVSVERNKFGYTVTPGFEFKSNGEGKLTPIKSHLNAIIYARPRETTSLSVSVNNVDNIVLSSVVCPDGTG